MPELSISFFKSRAQSFRDVMARVKAYGMLEMEGERFVWTLSLVDAFIFWEEFRFVYNATVKWVGSDLRYDSRPVMARTDKRDLVEALGLVRNSYLQYERSFNKADHCGREWGCRLLKSIALDPVYDGSPNWYDYGHYNGQFWVIDKAKILGILEEEAKIKMVTACPRFDLAALRAKVASLPDALTLNPQFWSIMYAPGFSGYRPNMKPVQIRWKGFTMAGNRDFRKINPYPGIVEKKVNMPEEIKEADLNRFLDFYLSLTNPELKLNSK